MKRLVVDLDGTLAVDDPQLDYADRVPHAELVERLRAYQAAGFEIIIQSARNMRTFSGQVGKINTHTLPVIVAWLDRHKVPYDEIHVGKPWCGYEGFYVDDRAIRPSEFLRLSEAEIKALLDAER